VLLELELLLLGAVDEPVELGGVESGLSVCQEPQRFPDGELAGHPEREALELDEPAERRIPAQLPVRLEPPGLLEHPGARDLGAVVPYAKVVHDPLERLAVGVDVHHELGQEAPELAALVR
jgi:hypothetical protein